MTSMRAVPALPLFLAHPHDNVHDPFTSPPFRSFAVVNAAFWNISKTRTHEPFALQHDFACENNDRTRQGNSVFRICETT